MVYKKYIEKNGKIYGPYTYHSKRIDGKVVSEYHGPHKKKKFGSLVSKKNILIVFGFLFLLTILGLFFYNINLTGNVALNVDTNYIEGEYLRGDLNLVLEAGELIPNSTKVFVNIGNNNYEYFLGELISDDVVFGDFFVKDKNVSGSGFGYSAIINEDSEIGFILEVYEEINEENSGNDEITGEDSESEDAELNESSEETKEDLNETSDDNSMNESSDDAESQDTEDLNIEEEIVDNEELIDSVEVESEDSSVEVEGDSSSDDSGEASDVSDSVSEATDSSSGDSNSESSDSSSDGSISESSSSDSGGDSGSSDSSSSDGGSDGGSSGITGNIIRSIVGTASKVFVGLSPTGNVIEVSNEVSGSVSSGEVFDYKIPQGKNVRIKEGSVVLDGESLDENILDLNLDGNNISISTDYFESEDREISINLDSLNLSVDGDSLKVNFVYENVELLVLEEELEVEGLNDSSNESNITEINSTETIQYGAVLNRPVKWKKIVKINSSSDVSVEIPKEAENISVSKVIESSGEDELEVVNSGISITANVISGRVSGEIDLDNNEEGFLSKIFRALTGRVVDEGEVEETKEVIIEGNNSLIEEGVFEEVEYEIEYETPAPYAVEEDKNYGKEVKIVSEEHYENILVYTELPKAVPEARIKVYHDDNGTMVRVPFDAFRTVEEGIVDDVNNSMDVNWTEVVNASEVSANEDYVNYIEWVVPHLSNQTYQIIIEITKAEHLDEDYNFVNDIYSEVFDLDEVWSEKIYDGEYIRVKFEQNLTSDRDITIYPRNVNFNNTLVEVYKYNSPDKIAEFPVINEEKYYKIYLDDLEGSSDLFDLKIKNLDNDSEAYLEFDHIIDPAVISTIVLNSSSLGNTTNENLTVHTDQDNNASVKLITDWRKDASSIAVLNMPFEGGNIFSETFEDATTGVKSSYFVADNPWSISTPGGGGVVTTTIVTSPVYSGSNSFFVKMDDDADCPSDGTTLNTTVDILLKPGMRFSAWIYPDVLSGSAPRSDIQNMYVVINDSGTLRVISHWWDWGSVYSSTPGLSGNTYAFKNQSTAGSWFNFNHDLYSTFDDSWGFDGDERIIAVKINMNDQDCGHTYESSYFDEISISVSPKDYSQSQNDGIVNGSTFNSTGGHDGWGAYEFDGVDDYIEIPNSASTNFSTGNFTISMWVNPIDSDPGILIRSRSGGAAGTKSGLEFELNDGDANNDGTYLRLHNSIVDDGLGNYIPVINEDDVDNLFNVTLNEWNFLTFVWNGDEGKLSYYGNAEFILDRTNSSIGSIDNTNDIMIGKFGSVGMGAFNGTIDDVMIFNRTLSPEQISALYNNRTDLIVSNETEIGDVWQACVTPNDGTEDGTESCSNNLTAVTNQAPNVTDTTPINGSITEAGDINFTANLTDDNGLANATIYLYNETGLYNMTTIIVSGTEAVVGIVITVVDGIYTWFWEVFDVVGESIRTDNSESHIGGNKTLTVSNITVTLNSSSLGNTTSENLTRYTNYDNDDSYKLITDWRKNDSSIAVLNMPFDSILNYSDDFNRDEIGTEKWGSCTGEIEDNRIKEATGPSSSGKYCYHKYPLYGDFDISVDYEREFWNPTSFYVWGSLAVRNNGKVFLTGPLKYSGNPTNYTKIWTNMVGSGYSDGQIATNDVTGKIRITRVGNVFTSYRWNSGWTQVGAAITYTTATDKTTLKLKIDNYGDTGNPIIYYDDLIVDRALSIDYSTFNNNATNDDFAFNSVGGYDGFGAYEFDGTDYVDLVNDTSLEPLSEMTLSMWVYPENLTDDSFIIGKDDYSGGIWNGYRLDHSGISEVFRFFVANASGTYKSVSSSTINESRWYHITTTFNASEDQDEMKFYLDGVLTSSNNFAGDNIRYSYVANDEFVIGSSNGKHVADSFNGSIDEVKVFNRSLSAEQVSVLYNNRTDLIVSSETEIGDVWQTCVTPNDGTEDGTESCSNNLTVLGLPNNIPVINSLVLNSSANENKSNENLTAYINVSDADADSLTINYTWYRNGGSNFTGSGASVSLESINLFSTLLSGNTTAGENWSICVNAYDSSDYSLKSCSENMTILSSNALPNTEQVILNSSSLTNYTSENLNCYANITDVDGSDDLDANYTWYKDGVLNLTGVQGTITSDAINLISTLLSGNTTIGENWTCSVQAYDQNDYEGNWNNASLIVLNSAPSISSVLLNTTSENNVTSSDLSCYATMADSETATGLYINYTWYKDGVENLTGQKSSVINNTLTLVSTLLSGNTTAGENWNCSVQAYDGSDYEGSWTNSTNQFIRYFAVLEFISPNAGSYSRGKDQTGEDSLNSGEIDNNLTILAKVHDFENSSLGLNANCSFFINDSLYGYDITNSTGHCEYQFDKTIYEFGTYEIKTNFSDLQANATTRYSERDNITNIDISINNVSAISDNSYGSGSNYYMVGEMSVLNFSIYQNNALTSFDNIDVRVLYSADSDSQATRYSGTLYNDGTGLYRYAALINSDPTGNAIRWVIRVNDSDATTQIITTQHNDRDVASSSGVVNVNITNESLKTIPATVVLKDAAGYTLGTENLDASNIFDNVIRKSKNHTIEVNLSTGESLDFYNINLSGSESNLSLQRVSSYSNTLPSDIKNLTSIMAFESLSYDFENATLTIPKNGQVVDRVKYCDVWDSDNSNCTGSWSTISNFESNDTHIWFNVTSFSAYAGGVPYNANLTIWDSNDTGLTYGDNEVYIGNQTYFYANYTNSTSGVAISGGDCNITFTDGTVDMEYNATFSGYRYNRSFATADTYSYTISCNDSSYDTISTSDSIVIPSVCTASNACAANTCAGSTCADDCGNIYAGTKDCSGGCTNTCSSEGFECGTQTICGDSTDCGSCLDGYSCSSGSCIEDICTNTCSSEGFECGTQTICGGPISCGSCSDGYSCSSGSCVSSGCNESLCGDWGECIGGVQTRECSDVLCEVSQSCICEEDWECDWTICAVGDEYSLPYNCIDSKNCGTFSDKPETGIKCSSNQTSDTITTSSGESCTTSWECSDWSDCLVNYDLGYIVEDYNLEGSSERVCVDNNKCSSEKIEFKECVVQNPIELRVIDWCEEEYVEVVDKKTSSPIGKIKESEYLGLGKIDVSFASEEVVQYCDYCYDGVKNYDEEKTDCGGPSCPECLEHYAFFDWLSFIIKLMWGLFFLTIFSFAATRRVEISELMQSYRWGLSELVEVVEIDSRKEKVIENKVLNFAKAFLMMPVVVVKLSYRKIVGLFRKEKKIVYVEKPVLVDVSQIEEGFVQKVKRKMFREKKYFSDKERLLERKVKKLNMEILKKKIAEEKAKKKAEKKGLFDGLLRRLRGWRGDKYYGTFKQEHNIREAEIKMAPSSRLKKLLSFYKKKGLVKDAKEKKKKEKRMSKIKKEVETPKRMSKKIIKNSEKERKRLMRKLRYLRKKGYYGTENILKDLKKHKRK